MYYMFDTKLHRAVGTYLPFAWMIRVDAWSYSLSHKDVKVEVWRDASVDQAPEWVCEYLNGKELSEPS